MIIKRTFDAKEINKIVNDPSVYPWVKGSHTGPIDVSKTLENNNNYAFVSEHGCVIFVRLQPGIYEFHASVLPQGRGKWMREGSSHCFHWMFTKTDAYELMTKCPDGNMASKAGAKNVGCNFQFRTMDIWPIDDKKVPVDVYSIVIQNWVINAPKLEEVGYWFHKTLIGEYKRLDRLIEVEVDDLTHDRYVGAAIEMIRGGQVLKAVNFYNRWAIMAGYLPVFVVSKDPLVIDISEARIRVFNNSFEVV